MNLTAQTKAATFKRGDVVSYRDRGLGIVVDTGDRFLDVAMADGSMVFGAGLEAHLKHRDPRANIPIPRGALGERWWTRRTSVTAALKRLDRAAGAGAPTKLTGTEIHGYRLSGWRYDRGDHYRIWLSVRGPIVAASLNFGELAVPKRITGQRTACERFNLRRGETFDGNIAAQKASVDGWLTKTITALKERANG